MSFSSNISIVLLTYKSKVLLMVNDYNNIDNAQNYWSLIESKKKADESFSDAVIRKTKDELNIRISDVKFLFTVNIDNRTIHISHGILTDNDVNCIERKESQEIRFFSFSELFKLQLAPYTNSFLKDYQSQINEFLVDVG